MNRVILITGASSGIGLATAKYLKQRGYLVLGLSRRMSEDPCFSQYYSCDLANPLEVKKTFSLIQEKYPHLYALVNCAGMGISGAVEYTTVEAARKIIDVNLLGSIYASQAAIPLLRGQKGCRIIQIASVAGELIIPFQTFYSLTKAAMLAFSEGLRNELRPQGIQVVSILPGDTKTEFTQNREKDSMEVDEVYQDRIIRSIAKMERDEQHGVDPVKVSKVIEKALKRRHVPVQMTVGFTYQLFVFLKRLLPKRFVSWILYQMYGK